MGLAKHQMMEEEERGFGSIDTVVCENCVIDYALKQYLLGNGNLDICGYCGTEAVCIDTEELMEKIMLGIRFKYSRAVDELGRNDGEYCGNTYDSTDVIDDVLYYAVEEAVFDDIADIMHEEDWCDYDPYGMRLSKEHAYMWSAFSEMVKKNNRYVFFRTSVDDEIPNHMILDEIANATEKFDLYEIFPPNHLFYRGRMHDKTTNYSNPKDLCSPPHEYAKSNRMSAEGISVFYGADSVKTAVAEIYNSAYSHATVASFKNLRELVILDLTKISTISIPSVFDEERKEGIEPLLFLRELLANLVRQIETMHSIEYVPAQVFAEYFRYVHKHNGRQIDGIAYNSSKQENGKCYVLFAEHYRCLPQSQNENFWRNYEQNQQLLELVSSSLNTYKVEVNTTLTKL